MDVTELAAELRTDDPDLPPAEAAFVEAVDTTKELFDAGEIDREEYRDRIAAASERYRNAMGADP